jgi:hypothetical protein
MGNQPISCDQKSKLIVKTQLEDESHDYRTCSKDTGFFPQRLKVLGFYERVRTLEIMPCNKQACHDRET